MGAPSMGHATRVGASASTPATEEYDFLSCTVGKQGVLVQSEGIRGTRSRVKEAVNTGPYTVSGALIMEPRPDDLDNWLPRILGGTETADNFPLAEVLPDFFLVVDKVAKVFSYAGCKVNQGIFRSSKGQNLQLQMDIEGKTETAGDAGTFPSISTSLSHAAVHPSPGGSNAWFRL